MNFNEEIISALLVVPEQILGLLKICLFVNCQFPWFFNYQPSCSHSASGLEVWYGQWVPHNIGTFVTVISFNNTWPTSIFYPDSASSRWWILKWCCDVEAFLIMHAMSLWTIVSHGGYQTDEVPVFLFILESCRPSDGHYASYMSKLMLIMFGPMLIMFGPKKILFYWENEQNYCSLPC